MVSRGDGSIEAALACAVPLCRGEAVIGTGVAVEIPLTVVNAGSARFPKSSEYLFMTAAALVDAAGADQWAVGKHCALTRVGAGELRSPDDAAHDQPETIAALARSGEGCSLPRDVFPFLYWSDEEPTLLQPGERVRLLSRHPAKSPYDGVVDVAGDLAVTITLDRRATPGAIVGAPIAHLDRERPTLAGIAVGPTEGGTVVHAVHMGQLVHAIRAATAARHRRP